MNSRERVIATLKFQHPDRVPFDLWALPYISLFRKRELETLQAKYPSDIGRPELSPAGGAEDELLKYSRPGMYVDEWGSTWDVAEPGVIGEVKHPALADWSALARFQPPWDLIRKRDSGHANRFCERTDKFMLSSVCARPFERLQFLRGTESVFMDLAYDTPELRQTLAMVHEFYALDVSWWAKTNVDGVFLMDDWGTNQALLINPDMWRAIFKPLYREYCEIIHKAGKFVFFHSDGNIEAIYPDLVEIGVDALNSQLFCMDIEELGRRHRGKITFWGEIDRQHVLPFGTPEDVRKAVRRIRQSLWDPRGGVIAQCEWGKDNSRENISTVFDAWLNG